MGTPLKDAINPNERRLAAGWVNPEKDPEKRRCRWCGQPITEKRRRTFCSKECVHELRIRTDAGYARSQVEKRDHGQCSVCGIKTARLERLLALLVRVGWGEWYPLAQGLYPQYHKPQPYPSASRCREFAWAMLAILSLWAGSWLGDRWLYQTPHLKRSLWDMDHIKPVVEGGGQCGLDNLRTLCLRCHKAETAELAARRARARKPQMELLR